MSLPSSVEHLQQLLERAAQDLIDAGHVAQFTADTKQSEWNLAQHLARAIEGYLPELQNDVDLIKPNAGRRRPDIVFHVRNTHASNYLVVEVKKDGTKRALAADRKKIREYWFAGRLRYSFGAVINLRSDNTAQVQVFQNAHRRTVVRERRRNP